MAGKETSELVDHEGDDIRKAALIADGEPSPLCVVHLTLDGADGSKAWSAKQVEHEEGVAGDLRESLGNFLINRSLAAAVENTERTDDVFLRNKTGDGGNRCLPVAPAERLEDPGKCTADGSENAHVDFGFI